MTNIGRHNNGPHNDIIDDELREITHEDDGSDIGADDWASPEPTQDLDDIPVFDRGRGMDSPDRLFDDLDNYTWE